MSENSNTHRQGDAVCKTFMANEAENISAKLKSKWINSFCVSVSLSVNVLCNFTSSCTELKEPSEMCHLCIDPGGRRLDGVFHVLTGDIKFVCGVWR